MAEVTSFCNIERRISSQALALFCFFIETQSIDESKKRILLITRETLEACPDKTNNLDARTFGSAPLVARGG